jgi:hypothetical protein
VQLFLASIRLVGLLPSLLLAVVPRLMREELPIGQRAFQTPLRGAQNPLQYHVGFLETNAFPPPV